MDKEERLVCLECYALLACQKYSLEAPSSQERHHRCPLGAALSAISIQREAKCCVGAETDAVQRLVFREAELVPFLLQQGRGFWVFNSSVFKTMKCS